MAATASNSSTGTARTYKPRAKKATAGQLPMVVEVQPPVEFDESDPKVQEDRERGAIIAPPPELPASIAQFAAGIGYVEALAKTGDHELIMQLARIAYTRGRQVARAAGVNIDGQ